jgi:hypothetical protein
MLIPHDEYPIYPALQEGESLAGYIRRFYSANGHNIPEDLIAAVRSLYQGNDVKEAFNDIQEVVGSKCKLNRDWWIKHRLDEPDVGMQLQKWQALNYNNVRFCSLCLAENNFHFALWELPLLSACPLHACELVSKCGACSRSLPWSALKLGWYCECGQSIKSNNPKSAKPWEIYFGCLLAHASDLQLPQAFRARLEASQPCAWPSYKLRDVYDGLTWAHYLRDILNRRSNKYVAHDWPERCSATRRVRPSAWEVNLLFADPKILHARIKRILKWDLREESHPMAIVYSDGIFQRAKEFLNRMPPEKHVFSKQIHECVNNFIAEYRVPIHVDVDIFFQPVVSRSDQLTKLSLLSEWWNLLANQIPALDPKLAVRIDIDHGYSLEIMGIDKEDPMVALMNKLLDAANSGVDIERFKKLTSRWQVRVELQRLVAPSEILVEIGKCLMTLPTSEIAFVLDLFNEGMEQ